MSLSRFAFCAFNCYIFEDFHQIITIYCWDYNIQYKYMYDSLLTFTLIFSFYLSSTPLGQMAVSGNFISDPGILCLLLDLYLACCVTLVLVVLLLLCSGLMCLLEEVTEDEDKWARVLYHLRHTLWPNGELDISRRRTLDFTEKKQLREDAVREIKHFLPSKYSN